jgi:Kdo2-lipid IVA lauroyltransferase/acyltransferase
MRRRVLEARAADVVSALVSRMPVEVVHALGRGLGRVLGDLDRRHVGIAVDNLKRAFPHWDDARLLRTARGVYAHFGQIIFDLLWLQGRSRDEVLDHVEIVGQEHAWAALAAGRGILFPAAHFGNWELHAIAHGFVCSPVSVVARPLDNPALDARLNAVRTMSGNTVIYKRNALAPVLRTLRAGGGVAILLDQNVQEKDGIFVDFFGRPAATTTVVAALAVKTGCALLPVHSDELPGGRYRLIYDPPVTWTSTGNRETDIKELTQTLTCRIEDWVRESPERWLWIHRRWKTQPSAEANATA